MNMRQINIYEANTQLSKLIADGEEAVIVRYSEPWLDWFP